MKQEITNVLNQLLDDTKVQIDTSRAELALYLADSTTRLANSVGQPGYAEALIAERDNVLLEAGIAATDVAATADCVARARLIGGIQAVLGLGAHMLAGGAL